MIGELFVDPYRCIGCRACVEACSECPSHGGHAMIHLDFLARAASVQTAPTVCMHCAEPACAAVCPADAIKIDAEGVVLSAMAGALHRLRQGWRAERAPIGVAAGSSPG